MAYTPMHYRKQPIYEDGDYAQLSIYVRGLGEMIRKFCNDQGVLGLGGRTPAEAVAHKIGAHRGDRRTLAADIDTLIKAGFLRLAPNALVVVQQEEFWADLELAKSARSARETNSNGAPDARTKRPRPTRDRDATETRSGHDQLATETRPAHDTNAKNDLSAEHHSLVHLTQDNIREENTILEDMILEDHQTSDGKVSDSHEVAPTNTSVNQPEQAAPPKAAPSFFDVPHPQAPKESPAPLPLKKISPDGVGSLWLSPEEQEVCERVMAAMRNCGRVGSVLGPLAVIAEPKVVRELLTHTNTAGNTGRKTVEDLFGAIEYIADSESSRLLVSAEVPKTPGDLSRWLRATLRGWQGNTRRAAFARTTNCDTEALPPPRPKPIIHRPEPITVDVD